MKKKYLSLTLVIPARNEEQVILKSLKLLNKKVSVTHKIIVIDDQSTDKTHIIVSKYIAKNKNVSLITTSGGKFGFANAIKLGIKRSETDLVCVVMADLCDQPETINLMYEKIEEGYDAVCGSRYIKGGKKIGGPKLQNFCSKLMNRILFFLTKIPTTDSTNAFKMYRREILNKITFPVDKGVEVSMEIIFRVFFCGAKILDIPTVWRGRTIGFSKFKVIERAPKYFKIFYWAIEKSFKK